MMAPNSSEQDSRFAHLLNPIKDLTKNWNVNIAKYLEEYLSEVDHLNVSYNGSNIKLNFAEAGLLIEGTAGVYSRKVDFLWQLLTDMLDALQSGKKITESNPNTSKTITHAKNTEHISEFDHLIPMLKLGKQIDLKKDACNHNVQLLVSPPLSLIENQHSFSKKKLPVHFLNNDIVGHKHDFRVNLSVCSMHSCVRLTSHDCCSSVLHSKSNENPNINVNSVIPDTVLSPLSPDPPLSPFSLPSLELPQDNMNSLVEETFASEDTLSQDLIDNKMCSNLESQEKSNSSECFINPMKPIIPMEPGNGLRPIRKCRSSAVPLGLVLRIRSEVDIKDNKPEKPKTKKVKICNESAAVPVVLNIQSSSAPQETERKVSSILEDSGYEGSRDKCFGSLTEEVVIESDFNSSVDTGIGIDNMDLELPYLEPLFPSIDPNNPVRNLTTVTEEPSLPFASSPICDTYDDLSYLYEPDSQEQSELDTYRQSVEKKVKEFLSSAHVYAASSDLDKRVNEWEELIRPRLNKAESRPEFNVCDYSDKILNKLSSSDVSHMEFDKLCVGVDEPEVSRIFLATLVLANTNNVEISSSGMNQMSLKLLSTERHQDKLQEFVAPFMSAKENSGSEVPSKKSKPEKLKTYTRKKTDRKSISKMGS